MPSSFKQLALGIVLLWILIIGGRLLRSWGFVNVSALDLLCEGIWFIFVNYWPKRDRAEFASTSRRSLVRPERMKVKSSANAYRS